MKLSLIKRRVEMLDTISKGFHLSAVISELSGKYKVKEATLYTDWERREKWMPILMSLEKYAEFTEAIESKLNAVQRAAWSLYSKADNDSAKVGALHVVLDSLEIFSNTVLSREILVRLENIEELAADKKRSEGKES